MFTTVSGGRYKICLKNAGDELTEVRLKVDQGVDAGKDEATSTGAHTKQDDFVPVLNVLSRVKEVMSGLHKNMDDVRRADSDHDLLSESPTARLLFITLVSISVIVASVLVQLWYLKAFFREKKIA